MYQALYRKYRSATFDELIGQKQVTVPIKEQVKRGEVSHAYLFSGTRGTGKTSAAKILSRAVNCLHPDEGNPCNQCEICKGILSDTIMDVVEMDAASNNGVDDIRELKERAVYPPAICRYKVYIIDEVHMLSKGAFNALLKILEEPPSHLIFILATTEPEKLPQTILSRCQRFNFKRISVDDMIKNMERILEKEGKHVDRKALFTIASHAGGGMRDALSLLDQCLGLGDRISYEDAIAALGMTNREFLKNMVTDLLNRDAGALLKSLEELYLMGKDMIRLTEDLAEVLRNTLIVKETNCADELILEEDLSIYEELKDLADFDYLMNCMETLGEALVREKHSMNPRQVLEMTLLKLTAPSKMSMEERITELEHKISQGETVTPRTNTETVKEKQRPSVIPKKKKKIKEELPKTSEKEPPKSREESRLEVREKNDIIDNNSSEEVTLQQVKRDWTNILGEIRNRSRITVYGLLQDGKPVRAENDLIVIGYEEKFQFHVNALTEESNLKFLKEVFSDFYKRPMTVQVKVVTDERKERAIEEVKNIFGEDIIEFK